MTKPTQPTPPISTGTTIADSERAIDALRPGGSVWISGNDQCWVTVERSADGKQLRYVRHTPNRSTVFHRVAF